MPMPSNAMLGGSGTGLETSGISSLSSAQTLTSPLLNDAARFVTSPVRRLNSVGDMLPPQGKVGLSEHLPHSDPDKRSIIQYQVAELHRGCAKQSRIGETDIQFQRQHIAAETPGRTREGIEQILGQHAFIVQLRKILIDRYLIGEEHRVAGRTGDTDLNAERVDCGKLKGQEMASRGSSVTPSILRVRHVITGAERHRGRGQD